MKSSGGFAGSVRAADRVPGRLISHGATEARGAIGDLVIFWGAGQSFAALLPPGGDKPNSASAREKRRCLVCRSEEFALLIRV